jgi:hypothetical protein
MIYLPRGASAMNAHISQTGEISTYLNMAEINEPQFANRVKANNGKYSEV